MLNSISIVNFRLFRQIQVIRLARINLIVGKNNSGKSAFLEAVELFASNASPFVVQDLVESRQETWTSESQLLPRNYLDNSVRHLFFEHRLPDLEQEGIRIGEIRSTNRIHLTTAAFVKEKQSDGTINRIRVSTIEPDVDPSDIDLALVVEDNGRTRRILNLEESIEGIRRRYGLRYYERLAADYKYPWQLVPTENMANRKVAALWDSTSLTDQESQVISALRLIDPRVSGIALVEDTNSRGRSRGDRIPLVKVEGYKEPLPLKSMGDGMTRLFQIIVALVNARNGILLVDEFENGLHWSVQPLIWKTIFRVASHLNVQVFATTHSRDCITGFDEAWNENEELGAFFRLDAKEGNVSVTEYTSETLSDSIEMDVEVR